MVKKNISKEQMIALIKSEAAKEPLCEDLDEVMLFGTEDSAVANWTVGWKGLEFDRTTGDAMAAIIRRLSAEYDVAWQTRH